MATNQGLHQQLVQVDVVIVGSWTHWLWRMWNNLAPPKVIQQAYQFILRSPTCLVDDILDLRCHSYVVRLDDWPPLVVVNKVGLPWTTLLPSLNFPHFHAFKDGGLRRFWDSHSSNMGKSNANEKERAMGFHIGTITLQGIFFKNS